MNKDHCLAVHGTLCPVPDGPHDAAYREAARRLYQGSGDHNDGDIDVDYLEGAGPVVSASGDGAYVAAWVWVPCEEIGLPSPPYDE